MSSGWLALLALLAGLAGGFLIGRSNNAGVRRSAQLDEDLRRVQLELDGFQARVTEHFTTTAKLLNQLTADYRAIHDHVSRGVQQLASGRVPRIEALASSEPRLVAPPVMVDELLEEIDEEEGVSARRDSTRRGSEGWYEDVAPGTEIPHYAKDDRYR